MLRLFRLWLAATILLGTTDAANAQQLSLFNVLPSQTRAFLHANDGSLACQLHRRGQPLNEPEVPDLTRNLGLDVSLLANAAQGELVRAEISLGTGRFSEIVVAQVARGESKRLVDDAVRRSLAAGASEKRVALGESSGRLFQFSGGNRQKTLVYWHDDSTIVVANNIRAAEAVVTRVRGRSSSLASERLSIRDRIQLAAKPGELAVTWFADPWLSVDTEPSQNSSPYIVNWDLKSARRHGLQSVRSLSGVATMSGNSIQATETHVQVSTPLTSSLRIAEQLRAGPRQLSDLAPADIAGAIQLNANVPSAFATVGPLFDDLFAEGVEGTYADVLEDLKSPDGLNIDLTKALYPYLGPSVLILLGEQGSREYVPIVYAFETSQPDKSAKAFETLMRDDPDAEQVALAGLPHPLWHVPPLADGESFSLIVARGHAIYSNDLPLLKQVLKERPEQSRRNLTPSISRTLKQLVGPNGQPPCLIGVRNAEIVEEKRSPLQLLFSGPAAMPKASDQRQNASWFMDNVAPWAAGRQVVLGFVQKNGWRFLSRTTDE